MMSRKLIAMLVVVAVLAGYLIFVELPRDRAEFEEAIESRTLTKLTVDDVQYVRIDRANEVLEFENDADFWFVLAPVADRAEQSQVIRLVHAICNAIVEKEIGRDDRERFGFSPPRATVTLGRARDQELLTLQIGNRTVDRSLVYVKLDGDDTVRLVTTNIARYSEPPVDSFRDRRLLYLESTQVRAITLEGGASDQRWKRDGATWVLQRGKKTYRADPQRIEFVLRQLRGFRCADFVDPQESPPFVPRRVIGLELAKGDPIRLNVGNRNSVGVAVKLDHEERVVRVAGDVESILSRDVDDFRERHLVRVKTANVGRISYTDGASKGSIVRTGDRWGFPNPNMGAVDNSLANQFLVWICNLEFETLDDRVPRNAFAKPTIDIVVSDRNNKELDRIVAVVNPSDPNTLLATSTSSATVGTVDRELMMDLRSRFQRTPCPTIELCTSFPPMSVPRKSPGCFIQPMPTRYVRK